MCVGGKCRPEDRQCNAEGITRFQRPWSASILPPYAAPLLGRSLSVSQQSEQVRLLAYSVPAPRYGFAVVIPGRYSSTPPPGRTPPEVFRASRRQPVGLLAQTVSEQVRHRLRRGGSARATPGNVVPPIQQWAVPAQAPEAVCPHTPSVFVGVWEPKVSQPLRRQSPPPPLSSRPPPGPRSTRFARSAPYGTGRLTAAAQGPRRIPRVCETASTIGLPWGSRSNRITTSTGITRPKRRKKVYTYTKGGSG